MFEYDIVYNAFIGTLYHLESLTECPALPRIGETIQITRTPNNDNKPLTYHLRVVDVLHVMEETIDQLRYNDEVVVYVEFDDNDGFVPEEW